MGKDDIQITVEIDCFSCKNRTSFCQFRKYGPCEDYEVIDGFIEGRVKEAIQRYKEEKYREIHKGA